MVIDDIIFFQSTYEYVNSKMYALIKYNEVVIVDPHKNEELTDFLLQKGIQKVYILLTHEHHDHTSGIYWYQEHFNTILICQQDCNKWISSNKNLRPILISFLIGELDNENGTHLLEEFNDKFVLRQYTADITYDKEWNMDWQTHKFCFYHIPGHSCGSNLIVLDGKYVFSGDSLMKVYPIITRFPGSKHDEYVSYSLPLMQRVLSENMTVFPGHGDSFQLKEITKNGVIDVQFR